MSNPNLASLDLFADEAHRPFFWQGGQPAALFIHGFMGTPAEMRPLAERLHQAGWTAQGLLLPGFGRQIDTLFARRYPEWLEAARSALIKLQSQHRPVIVVGYSMGAAVALGAAASRPPDGLVLMAPFWRLGNRLHRMVWQAFKRIFPSLQPFRRSDFSDPRVSQFLGGLVPNLDLGDSQVQDRLRQLRVPAAFVDQLLGVGQAAERAARQTVVPTLILQGSDDEAVRPAWSRQLLQRLPGPVSYVELDSDHDLVSADRPCFQQTRRSLLTFAQDLAAAGSRLQSDQHGQ